MLYNDDEFMDDRDNHPEQEKNTPNGYGVDDDDNIEEKDLKRNFVNDETRPIMEGKPMGGQSFGQNSVTPAGDDKNNPSQNAGYDNAYFKRNEPSEEHPENNNFKPEGSNKYQEGTADNDGNNNAGPKEIIDQQKVDENDKKQDDDEAYHVET